MKDCQKYDLSKLPKAELYDVVFRELVDEGDPMVREGAIHCLKEVLNRLVDVPPEVVDQGLAAPGNVVISGVPAEHIHFWNEQFATWACVMDYVPSAGNMPSPYHYQVACHLRILERLSCPRCRSRLVQKTEKTFLGKPVKKAYCTLCGLRWRWK